MKVALSEIKKNPQGTNWEDEAKIQINNLGHKEEKNIQWEQQEEKRIQKYENRIRSLWDISKHAKIWIIGVPEGEEKEQEIENVLEKIMKENFPNLVKEIDMQVQEAQKVLNRMDGKRPTLRHIIIKMPKFKDQERILKQQEKSSQSPTGEFP